ncbi:hypothetical protein ACX27_14665 [Nostoc piscinale CENA21]|uniref:Uncharacterized protein n=1 Tax=Nostoc piscinale CENA21 TaxID=224013 RepID=A0A0M4TJN1_9NOSO|nr:hypothetical protein [Nostoc piscinale]ALF52974.1 hypothetical protein ACX27_09120 [Nostoc piscinale CENA21]ALF53808.1 hypothetical protein ACX27_14665 [Nostoc piscinale CENA21]
MSDDQQKIVVEIPSERGYSPVPIPHSQPNKLEEFKRGWINAVALPDNLSDLIFDITTSITIPALISSCWSVLPLPGFIRVGGLLALAVSALVLWQMLSFAEIRGILVFRLILVAVGVVVGL